MSIPRKFDFSKFFDQISHKYLLNSLGKNGFVHTNEEREVAEAFLRSSSAPGENYKVSQASERTRGIPQGTSISLLLANVACWELDRSLERIGVRFSRYADDTLIWSNSYSKIVDAFDEIRRHSDLMEVPINLQKSEGISLIVDRPRGEIASKLSVDYLGYKVALSKVSIKRSRVANIKKKLSYLAYANLLQPLRHGVFNKKRLSTIDWDYIVALSQIRRYLYGGLDDERLRKYIRGQLTKLNFRGLMSYYPLVTDSQQLAELDGWLIHVLQQCLHRREELWKAHDGTLLPGPMSGWVEQIATLKIWTSSTGGVFDLRVPSFQLINKAMQIAINRSGIGSVAHPFSTYY